MKKYMHELTREEVAELLLTQKQVILYTCIDMFNSGTILWLIEHGFASKIQNDYGYICLRDFILLDYKKRFLFLRCKAGTRI